MSNILLSIVIPTKNRNKYLKSIIEYINTFADRYVELIIQDNSDDNTDMLEYLRKNSFDFLKYYYTKDTISVIENSDLAISHVSGEYVCYIGDDDIISKYIIRFVEKMKEKNIEAAVFNRAFYNWPGVIYAKHKLKSLRIPKLKIEMEELDVEKILKHSIHIGATRIENMPRVYHGIVKKECLDMVYKKTGTYFPGPSPDMANAMALCDVVKKHVFYGLPIVSSGTSSKSAGGLGAKHEHVGDLKGKKFLPADIEERWYKKIPKVWTGETIYAQSALEAINRMNMVNVIHNYNYIYLYAAFCSFHKDMKGLVNYKFSIIDKLKYNIYVIDIFLLRARSYFKNFLESKLNLSLGKTYSNILDSKTAAEIIDKEISSFLKKRKANI